MKVVVFTRYPREDGQPRGGVEAVAVVLLRALARRRGLNVHCVTVECGRNEVEQEFHGGFWVHRLPGSMWPQMLGVLGGPAQHRLISYALALNPDVIHSHETLGLGLARLPVPHVFTVHGFDHANVLADGARLAGVRSLLWRFVERYGLARQQHIISISPYVQAMLKGKTAATLYGIDNPIEASFFDVRPRPDPDRVLVCGWISPRKNTLGAVEAFALARRTHGRGTLILAGTARDGAYLDAVRRTIKRHQLEPHVHLVGQLTRPQLQEQLQQAAVFLLPSRQENAPMAIAEAMASGVPVVASDCCGMPYMVEDQHSGHLADAEDTAGFAARLVEMWQNPPRAQAMGARGRAIAAERFHPDAVASKTCCVYADAIDRFSGAAPADARCVGLT